MERKEVGKDSERDEHGQDGLKFRKILETTTGHEESEPTRKPRV